ncbi:Hypothetical protein FKW44_016861 [Caligus rogercresseyi]|uniref:Uncharacterized protein n=1 Tax=Caligus rogercresseyi TaxID=217165 RepID=A0A7T8K0Q3_CALRO|nr:Hypothetical protein FKW44_016861 [Caligus rogercresseyi]
MSMLTFANTAFHLHCASGNNALGTRRAHLTRDDISNFNDRSWRTRRCIPTL